MTKLQRYTIICIVFLAFLPLIHQFMRPRLTAGELFTKNFTAQKYLVTREGYRGNSSSVDHKETLQQKALYYEAVKAYSEEKYASAVLLFEQYLEKASDEDRKEIALYLGISYLSTQQLQAAKEEFHYLLKNGSFKKKQDAEWYLVLTLLKGKEIEQVKKSLIRITTRTPHAYQEKAQTLLEEIQQQYQP